MWLQLYAHSPSRFRPLVNASPTLNASRLNAAFPSHSSFRFTAMCAGELQMGCWDIHMSYVRYVEVATFLSCSEVLSTCYSPSTFLLDLQTSYLVRSPPSVTQDVPPKTFHGQLLRSSLQTGIVSTPPVPSLLMQTLSNTTSLMMHSPPCGAPSLLLRNF